MAITVYNGRGFVPRCVRSAAALRDASEHDVDVLLLDDCSPEPGFSDDLRTWADESGVLCYRSPRNLGIVRNVNLALLRARTAGYDYVVVCNSDVIFAAGAVDRLIEVAQTDEKIGSVTAWSNNVSIYSLPNRDPDRYLSDQDVVNWISATLAGEFGNAAIDVPAGISFCICMPVHVVAEVGLMDPIYGRGYCEETDWSLRSAAAGYRVVLSPSAFVYHQGRGSTLEAGMVAGGHSTVPENEAVIDLRYPLFRSQVQAFESSDILPTAHRNGQRRIIRDAARQFGWTLNVGWLAPESDDGSHVLVRVEPTSGGAHRAHAEFLGFDARFDLDPDAPVASLLEHFGGEPVSVGVSDRGDLTSLFTSALAGEVDDRYSYPSRV
jgi:GT2 family glycosyltransferase